jgi:antitoxin FitA
MPAMPSVVIRNLAAATHRALKARAVQHGVSTEAEIRAILDAAVMPPERIKLGSELQSIGRRLGGVELQIERDPNADAPVDFE